MNTTKVALLAGAAGIILGGLVVAIKMNPSISSSDGQGTVGGATQGTIAELSPFSHVATIPANVDPSTIRFEKLKAVDVASKTKTTMDVDACKEKQFRDPDGSSCQTTTVEERVKAVEAKYSYAGLDLASGESAPGREMFSVYFRPEEVSLDGPADKLKRDQAASMFLVSTYRPLVQQQVVDKPNSKYCDGNYVDGSWVRADPKCQDQVKFTTKNVPSPYLTVQVDVRQPATVASH